MNRPNLGCSLPASALSNQIVFIPDSSGQMAHLSQHKIGSVTPLYSLLGTAFYFVLEETMVYPPIFLAFFDSLGGMYCPNNLYYHYLQVLSWCGGSRRLSILYWRKRWHHVSANG